MAQPSQFVHQLYLTREGGRSEQFDEEGDRMVCRRIDVALMPDCIEEREPGLLADLGVL